MQPNPFLWTVLRATAAFATLAATTTTAAAAAAAAAATSRLRRTTTRRHGPLHLKLELFGAGVDLGKRPPTQPFFGDD